jgi:curved DNA-binding protein CbpA
MEQNKWVLKDTSLSNILIHLNRKHATGTLQTTTPNFTKKIFLVKGDAIFAASTYEDDRLGEMLLKAGEITIEQYEESVKVLKKTKKRQGAILVELGYLTPKNLFWGVKYQVREIIYSLFNLEDGRCEFVAGNVPEDEVITLKMSMGNLIYEGVKRINNWTRIKRDMSDISIVLGLSHDPRNLFQDVELTPEDKKVLAMIDGAKTVKEIIDNSLMNSFEVMKTIHIFWSIGLLEDKKVIKQEVQQTEDTVSFEDIIQPFAHDEEEFDKKVNKVYSNLGNFKMHELLEVDENSDTETIKKNYYRLSRDYHPDRCFASSDTTLKDKLTAIFDALSNAYLNLKDESSRKSYFGKSVETLDEEKAEESFKKGSDKLKENDLDSAVKFLTEAAKLQRHKAQYWSILALALSKLPNRLKEAEDAMLETIKLEPMNGEHYAHLGMLYQKSGFNKKAASQFEKALKFDPGNVKAQKGLKQIKK